jgi:hypothetical protein
MAESINAFYFLKIKGSDKIPSFSEQHLIDCDKCNWGCEGGWMFNALQFTKEHGFVLDNQYPYKMS